MFKIIFQMVGNLKSLVYWEFSFLL